MKILVAKSQAAPAEVVRSVAAALGALDAEVVSVDLGRIGDTQSRLGRVVKALIGEAEAARLVRELIAQRPDVAVAFDPGAASALVVARDRKVSETAVVAVVPGHAVDAAWAIGADRFAVVDDEAAVALSDLGVDGARIITVGPVVPQSIHEAAALSRGAVRTEYKIPELPVVLVDARDVPEEMLHRIGLQLSLLDKPAFVLFDAGGSAGAATWLRRNVPTLGLKGKLFGDTPNAGKLWRAADVVVARPSPRAVLAARALGAAFVGIEPQGEREEAEMRALAERGVGGGETALLLAGTVGRMLRRRGDERGPDGAAGVAELVLGVAEHKMAVLAESAVVAAAAAAEREPTTAGEAEDLESFGDDLDASDPAVSRLSADLDASETRAKREIEDSRRDAQRWDERRTMAEARGDARLAAEAAREADCKRARMHEALETLARLGRERAALRKGAVRPSEDEVLEAFKQKVRGRSDVRTVEDELAALKQRMQRDKKP